MTKKTVGCKDVGIQCDYMAVADTDDEVMGMMVVHAKQEHDLPEVSANMAEQLKNSIREIQE